MIFLKQIIQTGLDYNHVSLYICILIGQRSCKRVTRKGLIGLIINLKNVTEDIITSTIKTGTIVKADVEG